MPWWLSTRPPFQERVTDKPSPTGRHHTNHPAGFCKTQSGSFGRPAISPCRADWLSFQQLKGGHVSDPQTTRNAMLRRTDRHNEGHPIRRRRIPSFCAISSWHINVFLPSPTSLPIGKHISSLFPLLLARSHSFQRLLVDQFHADLFTGYRC